MGIFKAERIARRYQQRSRLSVVWLLALLLLAFSNRSASAWGAVGHRYATVLAIECLPNAPNFLKPLYEANRAWMVQHALDPDRWRSQDRSEGPNHFIDLDTWGLPAAATYPEDYWVAVGLYGKEAIDRNGLVPWRIGQYYAKLVRAFEQQNGRQIVEISAWLGHYVQDVHVPFHAVANYDGQLTGQRGIHARWESVLVERQIRPEDLRPRSLAPIPRPVQAAFAWARTGLKLHFDVLNADKEAAATDPNYGDAYYQTLGARTRALAIQRLEESAARLASLWNTAWRQAGRPSLPLARDYHAGELLTQPTSDPDRSPSPANGTP